MNDDEPLFTLAQARAMLPALKELLGQVQALRAEAAETQALIQSVRRAATGDGSSVHTDSRRLEQRLRGLAERVREAVDEITTMGVQIKDLDRGLVDWVALHHGRRVYICWERGEPAIGYWHELDAGFAGRQPILPEEWD